MQVIGGHRSIKAMLAVSSDEYATLCLSSICRFGSFDLQMRRNFAGRTM
jgi:hypothetical protein